jgi:ribulose 1,5-bisphosphate synthetase/thiazole synthase
VALYGSVLMKGESESDLDLYFIAAEEKTSAVHIIGSGEGGKYLAWHLAQSGQQTVVVERRWVVGL